MDAIAPQETRFLPALADKIGEWFPQLGGRSFAVSDASITKENVPTLPLVMVALLKGVGDQGTKGRNNRFEMTDQFIVEFWLEPARIKRTNGTETPFWSYYSYEKIRNTLLSNILRWVPPGCEVISYRSLTVHADSLAVTLTFGFLATSQWGPDPVPEDDGYPFKIDFCLCAPPSCIPDCCEPEPPPQPAPTIKVNFTIPDED